MPDIVLFTPLTLRALTLRNRIVLSPMCQYQAVDGHIQEWHLAHHGHFSMAGLGLAFVEATAVARDGRITHGCTGLYDETHVTGLKRIVQLYHQRGAACGIQIGHSGRRGSAERPWDGAGPITRTSGPEPAWQTVAPSAVPERDGYPVPRALSVAEIEEIVEQFRIAAKRALDAGFDVLEIHGAHGYLLHSFFSPVSNRRTDRYGGSREQRMKLPLDVVRSVREVWPADKPLFYRTSSVDGVDGGLVIEDSVALARALKPHGVDVFDCSSGGMGGPATLSRARIRPGHMVPYAETIRREAGIATMAVGAIIEARQAEAILAAEKADLVAIGREMMADPGWVYRAACTLGLAEPWRVLPPQYAFYIERRHAVLDRNGQT